MLPKESLLFPWMQIALGLFYSKHLTRTNTSRGVNIAMRVSAKLFDRESRSRSIAGLLSMPCTKMHHQLGWHVTVFAGQATSPTSRRRIDPHQGASTTMNTTNCPTPKGNLFTKRAITFGCVLRFKEWWWRSQLPDRVLSDPAAVSTRGDHRVAAEFALATHLPGSFWLWSHRGCCARSNPLAKPDVIFVVIS